MGEAKERGTSIIKRIANVHIYPTLCHTEHSSNKTETQEFSIPSLIRIQTDIVAIGWRDTNTHEFMASAAQGS